MNPDFDSSAEVVDWLIVPARPRKGVAWLAWLVILAICAFVFARQQARLSREDVGENGDLVTFQIQSRYLVGSAELFGMKGQAIFDQARALNKGEPDQRLRAIVLAGELIGPKDALAEMENLDETTLSVKQNQTRDLLRRLYADEEQDRWDAPSLDEKAKQQLRADLGWFGELALAPAKSEDAAAREAALRPARRTLVCMLGGFLGLLFVAVIGLIGLVVLLVQGIKGNLRPKLITGLPHAGVYAETFALYMVLFLASLYFLPLLPAMGVGPRMILATLMGLAALAWPVFRGIPWRQVRQDIGLDWASRPLREVLFGVVCYVLTVPLYVGGFVLMMMLMRIGGNAGGARDGSPVHPIAPLLVQGDWVVILQVFFGACIAAPLVEEIMFRGVLYRQLREATDRWGRVWSALASALAVSFLFAVIHPYALPAIAPVMGLALGFTLIREWRGSLIPGILAHGFHNGLTLAALILAAA